MNHTNNKKTIILATVMILAVAGAGIFLFSKTNPTQVACTQEAKICHDGSAVGRTGPLCEFAACPGESVVTTPNILQDIELTVDQLIEDSRCPLGVECFWEGRVVIQISATKGIISRESEIELGSSVELFDHDITLTEVVPLPKSPEETINTEEYLFVFDITNPDKEKGDLTLPLSVNN